MKFFILAWKVIKDFFVDGFVEALKGFMTGGSVGAIVNSWQGFLIGIVTGTILGAFIGSSLAKVFEWLLEKLHLLLNLRKIQFDLCLNDVSEDIATKLKPHYLLIRYGRDEVIQLTVRSNQDKLATRLRNKSHKIATEYNAQTKDLCLKFSIKRHVTYGVQFKLYFTGVDFEDLKPILGNTTFIKEFNPGGGDDSKIWVLIEGKTKVAELNKKRNISIAIAKSIEGIPNNFIYPK